MSPNPTAPRNPNARRFEGAMDEYQSLVRNVKTPEAVKERVFAQAHAHQAHCKRQEQPMNPPTQSVQQVRPSVKRSRKSTFAIAACLVALVLAVGASVVMSNQTPAKALLGDFTVRAYAASSNTILTMGSDGTIVFGRDDFAHNSVPIGEAYSNLGFYTGCMFRIEGEGITRIQAEVSKGELYRFTQEQVNGTDDAEKLEEAGSWWYDTIGQGTYYSKYDKVGSAGSHDGKAKDDHTKTFDINLYQRLGKTIDVPVTDEAGTQLADYSFGLWTNEPFEAEDPNADPSVNIARAIDTLDGTQLTITVSYADGTTSTKVSDLASGDLKALVHYGENDSNVTREPMPELLDLESMSDDEVQALRSNATQGIDGSTTFIHTLYGTIVEENNDPFPGGAASYPNLETPLTQPVPPEPIPDFAPAAQNS